MGGSGHLVCRVAAAAALREGLRLRHGQAGALAGLVLAQAGGWFGRKELVWRVLAFAMDVPEIAAARGFIECRIWKLVDGWEFYVLREALRHVH